METVGFAVGLDVWGSASSEAEYCSRTEEAVVTDGVVLVFLIIAALASMSYMLLRGDGK